MNPKKQTAVIIGAGPAGLTAALEFLRRTGIRPIVIEASHEIGGISRTIRYKGNRMDIGGHRFFSKSDRVMKWWTELMPVETEDVDMAYSQCEAHRISYRGSQRMVVSQPGTISSLSSSNVALATPEEELSTGTDSAPVHHGGCLPECDADLRMLIRPRKSRIYYLRRFFDYPIRLTASTLRNLGLPRVVRVGYSYMVSRLHQIRPENNLEDFLINRFGRELYRTFFKSYTEKVWGTPCDQISAEWGAQRIKGLSLTTALKHFVRKTFSWRRKDDKTQDVAQKSTDTSLIERFMYPKLGPGQLWEHVADQVRMGVKTRAGMRAGEIRTGWKVSKIRCDGYSVTSVEAINEAGETHSFAGDYFLSTMPVRELIQALDVPVPSNVREVSDGLQYRDFITIGLLVDRLKVKELDGGLLKDTWIYIQEPDVQLGRLQIFNNWSSHLVADPSKIWIGLEYFCYETDDLWKMADDELARFAIDEVSKIGILDASSVIDSHVVRVPKTYPAYFGTYERFEEVRKYADLFENLFLIGRNGMHKYNNQDHSMLTAMTVVDGLIEGQVDKRALWSINTEQDYHEEKPDGANTVRA